MATRYVSPRSQVFGDTGAPLPGAKLYFYATGTSTPKATYSDAGLTVVNANPVVADSAGRFGDIFLDSGDYKEILKTSADVTVWTADPVAGASASSGTSTATGNLLINGGFVVSQRATGTIADDAYCLDRWYALSQTASITVAQQANQENGTPYNIRLTQPAATAQRLGLAQIVEGADSIAARGSAVAFGGRIRCSLSQPIRYAILAWTGTFDAVTSDVVLDWTSASYAAGGFFLASNLTVVASGSLTPAANVWTELPAVTGMVSSSVNNLIVMVWTEGTLAQTATLDIGLMRLLSGETAGTFPARPVAVETALCQRYFHKTTSAIAAQGDAAGAGSAIYQTIPFPVTMRAAPTASATFALGVNNAAMSVANIGLNHAQITLSSIIAGNFAVSYSAGNTFTAEL